MSVNIMDGERDSPVVRIVRCCEVVFCVDDVRSNEVFLNYKYLITLLYWQKPKEPLY